MSTTADSPLSHGDHFPEDVAELPTERRSFLATTSMFCGLAAGYGMFGALAARYLYPPHAMPRQWLYVAPLIEVAVGSTRLFRTPMGQSVTITRRQDSGEKEDFIALSSVCPHLGCQVHWEPVAGHFVCPCHNGAFSAEGAPIAGPPLDAGQVLARFPLKVEDGLLFIEVPVA